MCIATSEKEHPCIKSYPNLIYLSTSMSPNRQELDFMELLGIMLVLCSLPVPAPLGCPGCMVFCFCLLFAPPWVIKTHEWTTWEFDVRCCLQTLKILWQIDCNWQCLFSKVLGAASSNRVSCFNRLCGPWLLLRDPSIWANCNALFCYAWVFLQ